MVGKSTASFCTHYGFGLCLSKCRIRQAQSFPKMVHGLYAQALKHSDKVFFQNPDDLKLFQDMQLLDANKPNVVVHGSG